MMICYTRFGRNDIIYTLSSYSYRMCIEGISRKYGVLASFTARYDGIHVITDQAKYFPSPASCVETIYLTNSSTHRDASACVVIVHFVLVAYRESNEFVQTNAVSGRCDYRKMERFKGGGVINRSENGVFPVLLCRIAECVDASPIPLTDKPSAIHFAKAITPSSRLLLVLGVILLPIGPASETATASRSISTRDFVQLVVRQPER